MILFFINFWGIFREVFLNFKVADFYNTFCGMFFWVELKAKI